MLKFIQKIPGGIMVVPMIFGAIINTFCPEIVQIGSFTTGLFSASAVSTLVGLIIFIIGTQIKLKEAPEALRRGGVLLGSKYLVGASIGILVTKFFGIEGIFGISSLAIMIALISTNSGLYMALVGTYGDSQDMAAQAVLNISDGPFLTLVTLGAAGLAQIPIMSLVAAIMPLIIGIILGNLDEDIRKLMAPGGGLVLPFAGFALGGTINFFDILKAGPTGFILAFIVLIISGTSAFLGDRFLNRRPGYAGIATATTAGNAIATPAAVALIDPAYQPYVVSATTQIAAVVIITAVITPMLTSYVAKKYGCPKIRQEEVLSSVET